MSQLQPLRTLATVLLLATMPALALDEGPLAPAWSLETPDGTTVEFDPQDRQRPAVLLFWATWCPYCRALMPEIQVLRESYPREALDIFAINVWEDADPVAHMNEAGYDYDLLLNGDAVTEPYGVEGTPGVFLVGTDGRVVYRRPSGAEPRAVRAAIEEALARAAESEEVVPETPD